MTAKEQGADKAKGLSERGIYRIDIPANRQDLLCPEGIIRSLAVYMGKEKPAEFKLKTPASGPIKLTVKPETKSIRPYVVSAILRDVHFTEDSYNSFIDLQEKLHSNICRKRTLVAIGTHDLDTLKAPFTYEALPPKDIKFKPLNQAKEMDGNELMEFYQSDPRLSKFLPIIQMSPVFPVIYDANRTVCSLPPIINGDHSKIKLTTKNVFIECTATDLTKAKTVLNTVVTMYSQYCSEKFTVEPVLVVQADGKEVLYPDLSARKVETTVTFINKSIGIKLTGDQIVEFLAKMGLNSALSGNENVIVDIPPTRSDILHACDVMEDVAIAFGFNNIPKTVPQSSTVAAAFPLNKLSDIVRKELALSGFTEVLPLILCSHDENYAFLRKPDTKDAVRLANPKTIEYQVVRTSLLQGVLKTIQCNKHLPLPLKVFEVSDVVFKDDSRERRSRNQRNMCALYCSKTSGFEHIHGILDRVLAMLNVPVVQPGEKNGYFIKESSNPTFFPGRSADVYFNNIVIGSFGIVHPIVLKNFEIPFPCSAVEINIEPFL
ncbi:hypothetical protein HK098_000005 [Nowakowskiella sp. JEL0407]|nr:hypothetical protein HK098_000005 [Nowakowskiella sp. JEL0407]